MPTACDANEMQEALLSSDMCSNEDSTSYLQFDMLLLSLSWLNVRVNEDDSVDDSIYLYLYIYPFIHYMEVNQEDLPNKVHPWISAVVVGVAVTAAVLHVGVSVWWTICW